MTTAFKFRWKFALLALSVPFACLPSWADGPAPEPSTPAFQVQQVDPAFDARKMASPGVAVHSSSELKNGGWNLPKAKIRDRAFYKAGLKKEVAQWDEMDKDMLFVTARDSNSYVLTTTYPKLPKERLLDLSKIVKALPKEDPGAVK